MRKRYIAASTVIILATLFSNPIPASAQTELTGDVRLACEAILCLATGSPPNECAPSLRRYFSISFRSFSKTIRGRKSFLNLCPSANYDPQMTALLDAQVKGAGRCDAKSLNVMLVESRGNDGDTVIGNRMPKYCEIYTNHEFTDFAGRVARYVGTPGRDGFWVEAEEYESALARYTARIWVEDEQSSYELCRGC